MFLTRDQHSRIWVLSRPAGMYLAQVLISMKGPRETSEVEELDFVPFLEHIQLYPLSDGG